MSDEPRTAAGTSVTYYVDEAGDGVLFGHRGRERLQEAEAKIQFTLTESEPADLPWHLEHQTPDFPLCLALANPEGCQPGAGG